MTDRCCAACVASQRLDDVGDILNFGSDRPRRPPPRWLIVVGVVVPSTAALAVTAVLVLGDHRGPRPPTPAAATPPVQARAIAGAPCQPAGWAQSPVVVDPVAGLVVDRVGIGGTLERCDRTATGGPWTVVVRRADGSLGSHGAVVTFPVAAPTAARTVNVDGATGMAASGMVVWPVAGAYARIRGDLDEAELVAIAARTSVVAVRPVVRPPVGYVVVSSGPYRSPTIHETRYGSTAVGEQAALGNGLTFTGVASGGGVEDQLYAVHADSGGLVHDRPAVVSSVFGGNATLAWEPMPGLVAYVGYSGSQLDDRAIAALQRLAGRARILTGTQWQATAPQVIDQVNEPG